MTIPTSVPSRTQSLFFAQSLLLRSLNLPEFHSNDYYSVVIGKLDVNAITRVTKPPIEQPASDTFLGWSVEDVVEFAKEHTDQCQNGIVQDNLVILDKQTMEDRETCFLVTPKGMVQAEGERIIVRADFRSSFTLLNVRIMGGGGDEAFENTGPDGVIRIVG
ncbi:hypothetical protein DL771_002628 [Monosporascus sp. 5C6A]|nr:hypothetical protein DL771_002628 [Monosporascus sp. 5C6A]